MAAQTNANYARTFVLTKKSDGFPLDLTGMSIQIDFKRKRGGTAQLTASTGNGKLDTGIDPTLGKITLTLIWADIKSLIPKAYWFDAIQIIDADHQELLFGGIWPLGPGITNDPTVSLPNWTDGTVNGDIIIAVNDIEDDISIEVEGAGGAPVFPATRTIASSDMDRTINASDNGRYIVIDADAADCRVFYNPGLNAGSSHFEVTFFMKETSSNTAYVSRTTSDPGDDSGDYVLMTQGVESFVIAIVNGQLRSVGKPPNI
jgi:hypothetical protein